MVGERCSGNSHRSDLLDGDFPKSFVEIFTHRPHEMKSLFCTSPKVWIAMIVYFAGSTWEITTLRSRMVNHRMA